MPRVADTPAVDPMPSVAAGPGYSTPTFRTNDYIPEIIKGQQTVSAGLRAQEEKDRADAKFNLQAAVDKYYMDGRAALVQKGGLLDLRGKQVLEKVNGKDFTQRGYDTLHGIADGIATDMQFTGEIRDEFFRRILAADKQFYPSLQQHYANEDHKYRVSVQQDRIAAQVSRVIDGSNIDEAFAEAKRARYALNSLNGLSTNPTVIEAQAKEDMSKGAAQYVANAILNGEPETANLWLMSHKQDVAKAVTSDALVKIQDAINTAMTQKFYKLKSDELTQRLNLIDSPTGRLTTIFANDGGADRALLEQITKESADAVGAQGWEDNPISRRRYLQDGISKLVGEVGGFEAAQAVMAIATEAKLPLDQAKARFNEAMVAAMKEGNPENFVNHLTPREKQAYVKFQNRYRVEKNRQRTDADYVAAASELMPLASNEDKTAIAALAKKTGDDLQATLDGKALGDITQARELFDTGTFDLSRVPNFATASDDAKQSILKLRTAYMNGTYESGGDQELYTELLNNPQGLNNLSPLEFEKLRARLGRQNFAILDARRREIASGGIPTGDVNQKQLLDAVNRVTKEHGWDLNDKNTRVSISYLVNGLQDEMRRLLLQRGTKGGLTDEDVYTAVKGILDGHEGRDVSWLLTNPKDTKLLDLEPDDINSDIKDALAKVYGLDSSVMKGDVLKMYYVRAKLDPSFSFGTAITAQDRARIIDDWLSQYTEQERRTGQARTPDDTLIARIWMLEKQGDTPALRAMGLKPPAPEVAAETYAASFDPNSADFVGGVD